MGNLQHLLNQRVRSYQNRHNVEKTFLEKMCHPKVHECRNTQKRLVSSRPIQKFL